jgi:hypothetical protein
MASFKPEFLVDGIWYDNAVRFATEDEAKRNAEDKFQRWTVPTDYRAVPSPDEPNYIYTLDGQLAPIATTS